METGVMANRSLSVDINMPRGKWIRTPEFREKMRQIWAKKRKQKYVAAMVASLRRKVCGKVKRK
jgi:hypothetical protein